LPQAPPAKTIGWPFIELESVDSTNNYARTQIGLAETTGPQPAISDGTTFFAHEQFAGKGQRGNLWSSQRAANIAMSIVIRPGPVTLSRQFELSAVVALSARDLFNKYAGDDTAIKWPNDLYWQDRKAGGILIESVVRDVDWTWAIIGVGININQTSFPEWLPNPVSLKQITGKDNDPVVLAKEYCQLLAFNFGQLVENGFDPVLARYNQHLYRIGQPTKFKKDNRIFEGTIKGVNPEGRLLLERGFTQEFSFGEITFATG
jgi:BirA family biotin operon repressor/biotin-[acetyl-CoA-carboxylase] ligase